MRSRDNDKCSLLPGSVVEDPLRFDVVRRLGLSALEGDIGSEHGLQKRRAGMTKDAIWRWSPVVEVSIGTSVRPQKLKMLLDTGSRPVVVPIASDGADFPTFNPRLSTTYVGLNRVFDVGYMDGCGAAGSKAKDVVSVGGLWVVSEQVFGAVYASPSWIRQNKWWSGILGVGFRDQDSLEAPPTFPQNLLTNGMLTNQNSFFTISYSPQNSRWAMGFGAIDQTIIKGPLLDSGTLMPWATPDVLQDVLNAMIPGDDLEKVGRRHCFQDYIELGRLSVSFGGILYPLDPDVVDAGPHDRWDELHIFGIYGTFAFILALCDGMLITVLPVGTFEEDTEFDPEVDGSFVLLGSSFIKDYYTVFDFGQKRIGLAAYK
ncbi:hypothetical protein FRB99_000847 [Tulasnella sp. 403]|nr:hypothetical protein FRB99_000847 [Tulasnella sp. 403]